MINIPSLVEESAVTIWSLKRFVKEHQKHFEEGINLNPKGTNKNLSLCLYAFYHWVVEWANKKYLRLI